MSDFNNTATVQEVRDYLDGKTMEINEDFELSLDEAQGEIASGGATIQVITLEIRKS